MRWRVEAALTAYPASLLNLRICLSNMPAEQCHLQGDGTCRPARQRRTYWRSGDQHSAGFDDRTMLLFASKRGSSLEDTALTHVWLADLPG
jgi:hypothetical protein